MKTCVICGGQLPPRHTATCSPKCRNRKLTQSEAFKQSRAKYRQSEKGRTASSAYAATEQRLASKRAAAAAYRTTEAGRASELERAARRLKRQQAASRIRSARATLAKAAAGTQGKGIWVSGLCKRCGKAFVCWTKLGEALFCSEGCKRGDSMARRRARMRGAHVGDVHRNETFERDGWCCQLCSLPVDREAQVPAPLAPTLDHIIPLAQGGMHEPANVQCAHFLCNSIKGDRMPAER